MELSKRGTPKSQTSALIALARRVSCASGIPAAAHIFALVGRGLGMAVRANEPDVIERVIIRVAVPVIQLKRRRLAPPLGDAANFAAMPARVEQIVF